MHGDVTDGALHAFLADLSAELPFAPSGMQLA